MCQNIVVCIFQHFNIYFLLGLCFFSTKKDFQKAYFLAEKIGINLYFDFVSTEFSSSCFIFSMLIKMRFQSLGKKLQ